MVTRGREQFSSSGHGAGVSDSTVPFWRRKAEGERSLGIQRCGFPFLDRTGLRAHLHTRSGHEATARLLLEKAANVADASNYGKTALILASYNGHEGTRAVFQLGAWRRCFG